MMKGKYMALKRIAEGRKEWQIIGKSWKSCTCFSADYLKKALSSCRVRSWQNAHSSATHARRGVLLKILDDKRRATLSNHATQCDNSSVVDCERRTQPGTGLDHEVWQYQHFLTATKPVKSPRIRSGLIVQCALGRQRL